MDVDQPSGSSSTSPLGYLEHQEASSSAELKPLWTKIRTQYEKKLWHNLTVSLTEFVATPSSGPSQIELFEKFISTIESKINALKLVEIARRVGREYSEPDLTLSFLQSVHSRLTSPYPVPATEEAAEKPAPPRPAPEAYALSLSSIAYAQLLLGDLPACKKSLDECETLLADQDTVEPIVNAGYYGVAGDYHKVKADYGPYYKNALLYLACVDIEGEMSAEDRKSRAHDLSIAALLAENIYNFGELLQHPILKSLDGTEHQWIKDLIGAFNNGEIGKFESLSTNFSNEASSYFPFYPILQNAFSFLRQKICLMALIQFAFSRPRDGSSRSASFQSVAEATRLPVHEVEHVLMKALSLGLIRGSLDQVDKSVEITWVQPRVLEDSQLETLYHMFDEWRQNVSWVAAETERRRAEAKQKAKGLGEVV